MALLPEKSKLLDHDGEVGLKEGNTQPASSLLSFGLLLTSRTTREVVSCSRLAKD